MTLYIDELTLRVSGISADDGRRLAELVARRLSTLPSDGAGERDRRVTLEAVADESLGRTAERIAAEVHGSLAGPE